MSGIMLATVGQVTPPADPLSIYASVAGGSVPITVTTASGDTTALPGGGSRIFTAGASGGTPPYSYTWFRQNGENKTTLESASGSTAHVAWSGYIVGDYWSTTANCRVTDSNGAEATSNTIVIGIRREV